MAELFVLLIVFITGRVKLNTGFGPDPVAFSYFFDQV